MTSSDQEKGGRQRPSTFLRRNKNLIVWVTIYAILLEIAFLIAPAPVSAVLAFANKILGVFDWAFIGVRSVAENMAAGRLPERTALSVHMFMVIWIAAYFIVGRILIDILSGASDGYVAEPGTAHERPQGLIRTVTSPRLAVAWAVISMAGVMFCLGLLISKEGIDRYVSSASWGFGHSFFGIAYFCAFGLAALKLVEVLIVGSFLWFRAFREPKT
jgi:hypothetical protein